MIQSKADLVEYLAADSKNYQRRNSLLQRLRLHFFPSPISDQTYVWKYIKAMRYCEYAVSFQDTVWGKIKKAYYSRRLLKYAYKTGFQIPPCVFGKGLTIWHWGMIIINSETKIGEKCVIHPNVIIGKRKTNGKAPIIGNNAYICGGGKSFG